MSEVAIIASDCEEFGIVSVIFQRQVEEFFFDFAPFEKPFLGLPEISNWSSSSVNPNLHFSISTYMQYVTPDDN